jgi:hypothetical protein
MNEFKIGSYVSFKNFTFSNPGIIIAFYENGIFVSKPTEFAVVADIRTPLDKGSSLVIHGSLLEHFEHPKGGPVAL